MRLPGQVILFRFPQTDLAPSKLRPALLLGELPGPYRDWLLCMISSQISQYVEGFDEMIRVGDADFSRSGLKATSVIRTGRLAVVESKMVIGSIGEIEPDRLQRIKLSLAQWLIGSEYEERAGP